MPPKQIHTQLKLMMRTPRGRMVTKHCWRYFGLKDQNADRDSDQNPQKKLFDSEP